MSINVLAPFVPPHRTHRYLEKSKELREKIEDFTGLADTLNAMGMLKMRHKLFVEAKAIFEKVRHGPSHGLVHPLPCDSLTLNVPCIE